MAREQLSDLVSDEKASDRASGRAVMADRFDNVDLDELRRRELAAYLERKELETAIFDRLTKESPIKVDHIYMVGKGRYAGRRMLVMFLTREREHFRQRGTGQGSILDLFLLASGPLESRSGTTPTGDKFNRQHVKVYPVNLDADSGVPSSVRK